MTAIEINSANVSSSFVEKQSGVTWAILAILAGVLALVAAAFVIGPVVLTLAALTLVPVKFILFIAISRP